MSRSYSAQDIIHIPTRTAEDAYAAATRLSLVASAVPAAVIFRDLIVDMDSLREALRVQIIARHLAPGVDPKAALAADRRLDGCWAALRDWAGAWLRLGDDAPRASELRELDNFLFGNGLGFLTLRFDRQWVQSDARIATLRSGRNAELVRALGGGPLLDALFAAHEAYGQALGTTVEVSAPTEAKVREARDALLASMREYVMAVSGSVRRNQPETGALADRLLRPLLEWQSSSSPRAPGEDPADDPAAPPPAEG